MFIDPSVDGHFGCAHILTIMYNAPVNVCVKCLVPKMIQMYPFLLGTY